MHNACVSLDCLSRHGGHITKEVLISVLCSPQIPISITVAPIHKIILLDLQLSFLLMKLKTNIFFLIPSKFLRKLSINEIESAETTVCLVHCQTHLQHESGSTACSCCATLVHIWVSTFWDTD